MIGSKVVELPMAEILCEFCLNDKFLSMLREVKIDCLGIEDLGLNQESE